MELIDFAFAIGQTAASNAKCSIILGMANGGDCVTGPLATALAIAEVTVRHYSSHTIREEQTEIQHDIEERLRTEANDATERQLLLQLGSITSETENLIGQYESVIQQLINVEMRINDNLYLAQQAAKHYQQNVSQIIDHLIGTEQGSVLRGNLAVQRADEKFAELLRVTYKMAAAFIHAYNLEGMADSIYNRVFEIVTVDGIEQFISYLEGLERDYCGSAGIDCDTFSNVQTLRVSLRDELFPDLVEKVGPESVITIGQQFHDIITSSAYLKRRVRGPLTVDQIEIPFSLWMNDRPAYDDPSERWMVSPLECNHIIVGRGNGTIGVNVVGTRLDTLRYELQRGNTDYIRGCEMESIFPPGGGMPILDYPVEKFIVGYAPHSTMAAADDPPIYQTRSGSQAACRNRMENTMGYIDDETCFRYFARDRSLGAIDWKMVIPTNLDGNGWILGDGLPENEKPIIEDIVLYFRYRSRPTAY